MKHNTCYLFLRGLGRNQFHWGHHESYKKELGHEVYFLDLPGFGLNFKKKSPLKILEITNELKKEWDLISARHPESKKTLVSVSLGGMVALDWANRYPQDWEELILINSSASDLSPPWERLRPKNYFRLLKIFLSSNINYIESVIFEMTCNMKDDVQKKKRIKEWVVIAKRYPLLRLNFLRQLFAAMRFKSPEKINQKALVLTSRKDQFVSSKCSERIQKKYNFSIQYLENAGHDAAVDEFEEMIKAIKNF